MPDIAISYAYPHAKSIQAMIDALLRIRNVVANIKRIVNDDTWTGTSRSQWLLFAGFVFSTLFALIAKNSKIYAHSIK